MIEQDPSLILKGEYPILLDEWTDFPVLWDSVRFEIDQIQKKGCFLLTGSSSSRGVETLHSGTGRIASIIMRPFSIFELGISKTNVSLSKLFRGESIISSSCNLKLKDYMEIICRGGWPSSIQLDFNDALISTYEYVNKLYSIPLYDRKSSNFQSTLSQKLLSSIARNILTTTTISKIARETTSFENYVTERTIFNYYEKLKNIFVLENVNAWNPHIRSRALLTKNAKHNFVDPSIAVGILKLDVDALINDLNYYGFLFESLCIKDLRILGNNLDAEVYYYTDNTGLDIDAIVQLRDGRWGAVQIKVGESKIDQAAKQLDLFLNKIDYTKTPKPSFVMILTGTEFSYTRKDGKIVVPLGLLEP
jgi:predicted AAA+ superfamily ATPase